MRLPFLRCASVLVGLSIVFAAAGCGADDDGEDASAVTVESSTSRSGGANDASDDSAGSDGVSPADCAALNEAAGKLFVNWQLVAQLGDEADLSVWTSSASGVGTLPEFADQLDTIEAQVGSDASASEQIEFMRGANEIVQRGIGGDSGAPVALSDLLGDDLLATLARKTPILEASAGAGC